MAATLWIMIGVGVLVLILGILLFVMRRKEQRQVDYRSLFIMGIIWLPAGIIFLLLNRSSSTGIVFLAMGLGFTIAGLMNRDKWGRPQRPLTEKEMKIRQITMIMLAILVVAGLAAFLLVG